MQVQGSVFAQLLSFVPLRHFEYLVRKHRANHGTHSFTAWSHLVAMSYAQLTRRDGLRDLVACLNSQHSNLYHLGLRQKLSRSTLADAVERRDWRLFEALGQRLISRALALHSNDSLALGLQEPMYAMDSTVIDRQKAAGLGLAAAVIPAACGGQYVRESLVAPNGPERFV